MSESKAVEQEEMLEEMEEEDLLNFADNLDFDKYADDMELRVLMDQVKERIDILERDEDKEMKNYDALVMEQQERNRNREKLEANGGMSNISSEEKEQWDEEQEVRNMADGLITDRSSGMREVHSTKSLAQLVKSSKAKASLPSVAEFDINLVEPKIITHTDDEGMRLKEKNSVSKLPYMNRNPAV